MTRSMAFDPGGLDPNSRTIATVSHVPADGSKYGHFVRAGAGAKPATATAGLSLADIAAAANRKRMKRKNKKKRTRTKKKVVYVCGLKTCKMGKDIKPRQQFLTCFDCDVLYHRRCMGTFTPAEYSQYKKTYWNCGCLTVQNPDMDQQLSFNIPHDNNDYSIANHVTNKSESFCEYESEINFGNLKGLKFGHLNVRGLRGNIKIEELRLFLTQNQFLVFSLNETFLNKHYHSSRFNIFGYNFFRYDRRTRAGGGSCIYVRNDCIAEEFHFRTIFPRMLRLIFYI